MENISGTRGEIWNQMECPNILLDKLKLCIIQDHSIMGPNKPASQ